MMNYEELGTALAVMAGREGKNESNGYISLLFINMALYLTRLIYFTETT